MQLKNTAKSPLFDSQHGFSLIELFIVVVALGILLAIAIPQGMRMAELHRLETSVSIIGNKLMQVRTDAIKRNRTSWLRLDPAARTVRMQTTDDLGNTIDVGGTDRLTGGVEFAATEPIEIQFDSLGRLPAGSQTFAMRETNSKKTKSITISPAGKVSIGAMYKTSRK